MEDSKMLERAAKAAGYEYEVRDGGETAIVRDGRWWPFNPLEDDGDALRLAVACKITDLSHALGKMLLEDKIESEDLCYLVRRAITKAAAETGVTLHKEVAQ